ncbi:MAG: hypothetical protein ACD_62C00239G0001 [uncultured bacterium]|nr:MAG: hypothetical protein ACD_62C00239G0001 [uncultured bacterium]
MHYLTSTQLAHIITLIDATHLPHLSTLQQLAGLKFEDICHVLELDDHESTFLFGGETYRGYNVAQSHLAYISDKSASGRHHDYAQAVIKKYGLGDKITPAMVLSLIVIESNAQNDKVNESADRFGLTQIGWDAFAETQRLLTGRPDKQIVGINKNNLKQFVLGSGKVTITYKDGHSETMTKEKLNITIGALYLHRCLTHYNPTGSIALALANYNWSDTNMIYYHMPYYFGITTSPFSNRRGQLQTHTALDRQPLEYIAKYLVLQQMFKDTIFAQAIKKEDERKRNLVLAAL